LAVGYLQVVEGESAAGLDNFQAVLFGQADVAVVDEGRPGKGGFF